MQLDLFLFHYEYWPDVNTKKAEHKIKKSILAHRL